MPPQAPLVLMISMAEVVPTKSLLPSPIIPLSSPSPTQLYLSPSPTQPSSSQVFDVSVPPVLQQVILEHGVDDSKFLLAMEEKMLTTVTSCQASISNLAN